MPRGRRFWLSLLPAAVLGTVGPQPAGPHEPVAAGESVPGDAWTSPNPNLAVIRPAPDFTLRDLEGRAVLLSAFRGRVVLLSFIYTSCPAACPLLTQRMALLQDRLRTAGLFPSRVAFLSVTVDPARDTVASLTGYAKRFGADPEGWRFLREAPERLRAVLAAYDEWTAHLPGGELDHPARLYLVDPQGRIREIYTLSWFDERQAFLDIQALLRESP